MLHMIICDDDKSITSHVKDLIERQYTKKIDTFCCYDETTLKEHIKCNATDMIILDIALGEADGIAIAKDIGAKYPNIKVILLSGFAQLASNVFDADPVYFLSKPIKDEKLYAAVDKAIEMVSTQEIKVLTVNAGGKVHRIMVSEIVYMEIGHRSCKFYMDDGSCVEANIKLSDVMAQLPDHFIFTHQSFACNVNKIKSFSKEDGIEMIMGQQVPVSRRHYKKVKEAISLQI